MIPSFVESLVAFLSEKPLLVIAIIWMLFNLYKNSKPIPEYPGNVRAIKTKKEWNQLREESKRDGKHYLVDYYADWCGPCRSAAPIYAEMSKVNI